MILIYLRELLVVHVPDGGDLPGVGLLNGGHLLLQPAILQLQASHVLNVSSEPELYFKMRDNNFLMKDVPTCHSAARVASSLQSWISWLVREERGVLVSPLGPDCPGHYGGSFGLTSWCFTMGLEYLK